MAPLFVIFYNLRALGPAWQLIPVAVLGNLGPGGEWHILCGDVVAHSQPRTHAPPAAVSHLYSRGHCHGRRHHVDSDRRRVGALLRSCCFSPTMLGIYYSLPGVVRHDSARGMKKLFPILSVLTALFLAYALYLALSKRDNPDRRTAGRRLPHHLLPRAFRVDCVPAVLHKLRRFNSIPGKCQARRRKKPPPSGS